MTTKGLLQKQIIVPINSDNKSNFIVSLSKHITNLNSILKSIKLEFRADFVYLDQHSIIIIINKVTFLLDLQTIKKYIRNTDYTKSKDIKLLHLPQLKSYLKIIDISYLMKNTNTFISSSIIKSILKNNHIFNNMLITSKSCIIKMSPKLNMAIVWLDIWDVQSGRG